MVTSLSSMPDMAPGWFSKSGSTGVRKLLAPPVVTLLSSVGEVGGLEAVAVDHGCGSGSSSPSKGASGMEGLATNAPLAAVVEEGAMTGVCNGVLTRTWGETLEESAVTVGAGLRVGNLTTVGLTLVTTGATSPRVFKRSVKMEGAADCNGILTFEGNEVLSLTVSTVARGPRSAAHRADRSPSRGSSRCTS